jgi:hypothetical protein
MMTDLDIPNHQLHASNKRIATVDELVEGRACSYLQYLLHSHRPDLTGMGTGTNVVVRRSFPCT